MCSLLLPFELLSFNRASVERQAVMVMAPSPKAEDRSFTSRLPPITSRSAIVLRIVVG